MTGRKGKARTQIRKVFPGRDTAALLGGLTSKEFLRERTGQEGNSESHLFGPLLRSSGAGEGVGLCYRWQQMPEASDVQNEGPSRGVQNAENDRVICLLDVYQACPKLALPL